MTRCGHVTSASLLVVLHEVLGRAGMRGDWSAAATLRVLGHHL